MGKVYCSVYNGIGNQLFGYALGMFLSRKYNKELHIDLTKLNTINSLAKAGIKKDTPSKYELTRLGFNEPVRQFHPIEFLRKFPVLAPKSYAVVDFRNDHSLNRINGAKNIYSIGWGDLSVVEKVLPEMKKKFSLDFELKAEAGDVLNLIQQKNAVALHIRRTDYLYGKTGDRFGGICTDTYYQKAIRRIKNTVSNPFFVVFSDD
ncbi:MAG: alpha-1,2-fucosyltransferase, partial [Prolixibacteraceae bacterium]